MGFWPFFRKELTEWRRSRRAMIVALVTSFLATGMTITPWLRATFPAAPGEAGPAGPLTLDPTLNLIGANWNQWLTYISIFVAMGLMAGERDRGTLAWSLSKPLSRTALLLAKWSAGTLVYSLVGLWLPMAVSVTVATLAYGALPDMGVIGTLSLLLVAVPAFYIALSIALGTRIPSQPGVAGIAIGASFLPMFVAIVSSGLALALPTGIGDWAVAAAVGVPVDLAAPTGWLVGMVALAAAAHYSFSRAEL
jgi:ABC-type transport system involved in multi-copper enzyme maturation permease subunit